MSEFDQRSINNYISSQYTYHLLVHTTNSFFVSSIEMKYDRHDQISELKQISIDCRGLWGSSNDLFALNWVSIFAKFCQDRNDTRTLLYNIQEKNKTQLITLLCQ